MCLTPWSPLSLKLTSTARCEGTTLLVFSALSFLRLLFGAVSRLTAECLRASFSDLVSFLCILSLDHLFHLLPAFKLFICWCLPSHTSEPRAGHPNAVCPKLNPWYSSPNCSSGNGNSPLALVQAPHLGVSFISIWLYSRNASTD